MSRIETFYCTIVVALMISGVFFVPVSARTFDPIPLDPGQSQDLKMMNDYGITVKKLKDVPQTKTSISSSTGKNANPVVNAATGRMQAAGMEVTSTQTGRYEISVPDASMERINAESAEISATTRPGFANDLETKYPNELDQFRQVSDSTKSNARHENGMTVSEMDITSVTFTNKVTHESRDAVILQAVDRAGDPTGHVQILSDPAASQPSGSRVESQDVAEEQRTLQHKYYWSCVGLKLGFWFIIAFLAVVVLAVIATIVVLTAALLYGAEIAVPLVLVEIAVYFLGTTTTLSTIVTCMCVATVIGLGAIATDTTGMPLLFNSMKETCTQKESYFNDIPEPMRAHWNLLDNHRAIAWQSSGNEATSYTSVRPLPTGGSVAAGFLDNGNTMKGIVTTFDPVGKVLKSVSVGEDKVTTFNNVQISADGSIYIFGDTTSSPGPDIPRWKGTDAAALVIKMDPGSNIMWSRTFGKDGSKTGFVSGTLGNDGRIYAAGSRTTDSLTEGYIAMLNPDGTDYKVSSWGNLSSHAFLSSPGTKWNELHSIKMTPDNNLVLAGSTIPPGKSETEGWILKLGSDGNTVWSSSASDRYTAFSSVLVKPDGGYVTVGSKAEPRWDGYLFADDRTKLNGEGVLYTWNAGGVKTGHTEFANLMETDIRSINPASDGRYIVAGLGHINGGPIAGAHGGYDAWVAKLRPDGSIAWQKTLGGTKNDELFDAVELPNGDVIASGYTKSTNYDLRGRSSSLEGSASGWIIDMKYDAGKAPDTMDVRLNE